MIDSRIVLQEAHSLHIQRHLVPGCQYDAGVNRQSDGRTPADKGNASIHDNQVGFDGDRHLHRSLRNKHVVVRVKMEPVKQMRQSHRQFDAHGKTRQIVGFHRGQEDALC